MYTQSLDLADTSAAPTSVAPSNALDEALQTRFAEAQVCQRGQAGFELLQLRRVRKEIEHLVGVLGFLVESGAPNAGREKDFPQLGKLAERP